MNAIPIKPVMMKVIPKPFKALGTFEYDNFEIKAYSEVSTLQKKLYGFKGIFLFAFLLEYPLYRITGGTCLGDIKLIGKIIKLKLALKNNVK